MKKLILLVILLLRCGSAFCALEDFTTYTETDADGKITITSATRVDWADARTRGQNYSVFKDYGVGHFGNFTHLLGPINVSTNTTAGFGSQANVWMVSNVTGDAKAADDNNHGLVCYFFGNTGEFDIEDLSDNSVDLTTLTLGTDYWLTISRSGNTFQVKIYTDSGRSTLVSTLSTTCETAAYRYVNVFSGYNNAASNTPTSTGYVQNLDIQDGKSNFFQVME